MGKNNFVPIIDWLEEKAIIKKANKGDFLQYHGSTTTKGFYVKSGLLRSYAIDDNGKEHIFMFAPEGWLISDIHSHTLSEPSELFIDAMEDTEYIEISYDYINDTKLDKDAAINKLLRRISVLQKRVILLMSANAKQRYEHFIETYPQLLNRVPQKMIASYLGITPEALSNIRSKIKKQKN